MKSRKKVYLVVHHEIFSYGSDFWQDEMVFCVASTIARAIGYIKKCYVEPFSWWEIQETRIDDMEDWPISLGLFGRRGGRLKSSPYRQAVEVYMKSKAATRATTPPKE